MGLVGKSGVIEIGDKVFGIVHENGSTNSGFLVGDEGVIVIEALETRRLAEMVKSEVRKVTEKPIRSVICTHFHGDHSLGNQHYMPAHVIGHSQCREEMIDRWDYSVDRFASRYDEKDPEQASEHRNATCTPPDIIFENDRLTMFLGDKRIELYYFGKAHTAGDIVVYLPQDKVLYSGDVITEGKGVPYTADGFPANWAKVIAAIEELDIDLIVPGHGRLGDKSMAVIERELLAYIAITVRGQFDSGVSPEEASSAMINNGFDGNLHGDMLEIAIDRLYKEFSAVI